ncbi:hypothetical protein Mapa_014078 [Marchantia paleacea]|nr:hypothetical protein Mapa_014078 [Marchantia paleacea]
MKLVSNSTRYMTSLHDGTLVFQVKNLQSAIYQVMQMQVFIGKIMAATEEDRKHQQRQYIDISPDILSRLFTGVEIALSRNTATPTRVNN